MENKLFGRFMKINCKRQKEFRDEKAIERKGDKLYVKGKHDHSFNSWKNKKNIIRITSNYALKADLKKQQLMIHLIQQQNTIQLV